ncbi:trichohyalin, putative [Babesia caballi]|uniref:Trichohyalin, putative n=1 Tax=Babesia caballi TaxID=5871 RepID=A0AAV4LVC7_BABCB|nr:trichohyalin, putative [Babesia caballi]
MVQAPVHGAVPAGPRLQREPPEAGARGRRARTPRRGRRPVPLRQARALRAPRLGAAAAGLAVRPPRRHRRLQQHDQPAVAGAEHRLRQPVRDANSRLGHLLPAQALAVALLRNPRLRADAESDRFHAAVVFLRPQVSEEARGVPGKAYAVGCQGECRGCASAVAWPF